MKLIKTHQDSIKDIPGISSNEKFNGNQNKLKEKRIKQFQGHRRYWKKVYF